MRRFGTCVEEALFRQNFVGTAKWPWIFFVEEKGDGFHRRCEDCFWREEQQLAGVDRMAAASERIQGHRRWSGRLVGRESIGRSVQRFTFCCCCWCSVHFCSRKATVVMMKA